MLVWRKGNINRTVSVLQYCVLLQWYEQFLQVGRLYWALILLGLAVSSWCYICIKNFLVTSSTWKMLVMYVQQERQQLYARTAPVSEETFVRPDRRVPLWVKLVTPIIRNFFQSLALCLLSSLRVLSLITTATAVLLPFFSSTRVNQYDDTDHTDPRSDKQFSSCLEVTERCLLIQCYRFAVVNVGKCYGTFHLLYQQRKCDSVFTVAFYQHHSIKITNIQRPQHAM